MRRRGFYFLLSASLVLITATIIALALIRRGPIAPPQPGLPSLANRLGELAWIQVARGTTKVDFANVAGRWVVIEKDNYPADPARLQRLLFGLAALTPVEPKSPEADRSVHIDRDGTAGAASTLITLRGRVGDTVAQAIVAPTPNETAAHGAEAVYVRSPTAEL